jgi:cytochrome c biogenesis protein CcmG, thiol:disulfide interchange protein DsbE
MSSRTKARRTPPPPPPPPKSNRAWIVLGGFVAVVVVAVIVAVVASGGGSDSSSSSGKNGGGSHSGTAVEVAPVKVTGTPLAQYPSSGSDKAIGSVIPTLDGQSLFDGSDMTIAPTGKPMAVVFVAHWCPHCQAEVPRVVALAKAGKLAGIDVVAVATGTRSDLPNYPPSAWLEKVAWPYPTMADSANSTAAVAYGLTGYPMFVLTDASGKVVARSEGEISDSDIIAAVKAVKAGKPADLGAGASSSK